MRNNEAEKTPSATELAGRLEPLVRELFLMFEDKSLLGDCAYQGPPGKSWWKARADRYDGWNEATRTYRRKLNEILLSRGIIQERIGPVT